MAKFSSCNQALVWVSLVGALAGCSTVPDGQRLEEPPVKVPDAAAAGGELVPRAEPPSRSGNPDTYVVFGRRYRVRETSAGYRERGIASWYGWQFHGRKTSSGPPFNMFDLTAAHKSLPLPTYVRVTNLDNGRSAVVKVTDRGPFVGTRLIDLSYAAADRLGMLEQGTAAVEVAALEPYQFLPKLAARRAEQRELLASRAMEVKPAVEVAAIEFAHAAPIRTLALAPGQPPVRRASANMEPNPPVKAPIRLAQAEGERKAPKATAKPAYVKPVPVSGERSGSKTAVKLPVRLALADGERTPPLFKPPAARLASAHGERNPPPVRTPVRLALPDVERRAPKAAAKTADAKLVRTDDHRNPGRTGFRPPASSPAPKGKETTAKPAVPSASANRAGKPVPARQAGESRPVEVRLASLKISRSRGVAD
jgi:rare lipoprotein A (peptidoglycan hydrolase)